MLDNQPVATPLSFAVVVACLILYLTGDTSAFQALVAGGVGVAGSGLLGVARNGAGRGVK